MNREWFSAAELADLAEAGLPKIPTSKSAVIRRAKREGWESRARKGQGGGREYHISSLPGATRAHLAAQTVNSLYSTDAAERDGAIAGRRLTVAAAIDRRIEQRSREQVLSGLALLGGTRKARAEARLTILSALRDYQRERPEVSKTAAIKDFCVEYNARRLLDDAPLRQLVRSISYDTINRWQKTIDAGDTSGLSARYGNRKGSGKIDRQPALRRFAVALLAEKSHASGQHLLDAIEARFGGTDIEIPSIRSCERWLTAFKRDNAQLMMAIANPDAWKNHYMTAFGDASEDVVRLNQRWELDGTPGDIDLLDGRHALIGVIDVFSRRARLLVCPTQKAAHVASLVRWALLNWGVCETAKTDNGQDYKSHHMGRVFDLLDIEQYFSDPFSGWQKPHVERFFRTFSHGLLEMAPGYIGHNVAEREALRARQSFADRLFKKGEAVEIRMTAAELQAWCDDWVETIYQHHPHEGLNGKTPFEVAAAWTGGIKAISDPRALDILLAEAPGDGARTVRKKGIYIDNLQYVAPELGELVGERVAVRHDPADMGLIYVFHEDAFFCIAECPEVTGVSRQEVASEARQRQKKRVQEARKELRAAARQEKTADIAQEIMEAKRQQAASLTQFPHQSTPHESAGLIAAADAASAREARDAEPDLPPVDAAAIAEVNALLRREQLEKDNAEEADDRFRRWIRLHEQAEPVDQVNAAWMSSYEQSDEFRGRKFVYDDFGPSAFGVGA